jgi:hypothetical protein
MEHRWWMRVLLGSVLFLSACSQVGIGSKAPKVVKPEADKTTLTGQLLFEAGGPMVNTVVRLGEVYREGEKGAYIMDQGRSPVAATDANGYFVFENVPPNEYVVIIQQTEGVYTVVNDKEGKPKVWKAEAGKVLDVGSLRVKLPEEGK